MKISMNNVDNKNLSFNKQIWIIGAAALLIRIVYLLLSDPGMGEADATARLIFALRWKETPFLFPPTTWPPMQFYIYGTALSLFYDALYTPLAINILFSSLLVVVIGHLVKQLSGDSEAGKLGAAITACFPLAIRFSLIAVPEVILNFFIFLTLYLLVRTRSENQKDTLSASVILATLSMAIADLTHLEAWFLMPVFSLLLWGKWRRFSFFIGINAIPIIAFMLHVHGLYQEIVPPDWRTYSYDSQNPIKQIFYYPSLLLETLSPLMALLGLFAIIRTFDEKPSTLRRQLIPALCLLFLIPPYLLFVFAWDRMRPKEALLLALFFIPYSAMGLAHLKSTINHRLGRRLVVVLSLGIMLFIPYNWRFLATGNLSPIPRATKEYREVEQWLNQHIESEDAVIFDHLPMWSDYYFAAATRRIPEKAFLFLKKPSGKAAENIQKFISDHHPVFLVMSKKPSTISTALKLNCNGGCPETALESAMGVDLEKGYTTKDIDVYRIKP